MNSGTPTKKQIRKALLDAFRMHGRKRIPLPALVSFAMRQLGTTMQQHLDHFLLIHGYIRANWGNNGLFSRRRGVEKGGIKVRDRVKL